MNILALLRMMPDPASELELNAEGPGLDREWLDFQLNDFDDQALEEAILLKEATDAKVLAVAVGEGAPRVLQMAMARGADAGLSIQWDSNEMVTTPKLAATVAAIARERGIDLILTGVQSAEDVFGQAAPYLGGLLDWPHVSGTSQLAAEDGKIRIAQERGGGVVAHYVVPLPAVLGVQTATKAPRYVSGSRLREAAKMPIEHAERMEALPSFAIRALGKPTQDGGAENLGAAAELVAEQLARILTERGLTAGAAR